VLKKIAKKKQQQQQCEKLLAVLDVVLKKTAM
jgi:hypothetical protein